MQNQKAEKSGVVFGFAITLLVILCIQLVASWGIGPFGIYMSVMAIAGIITVSIFISKYKKYGYDMPDAKSYGIVFIVFGVLGWGWFVFGLVAGILILCLNKPKN